MSTRMYLLTVVLLTAVVAPASIQLTRTLHPDLVEQCKSHDWPAHQHARHIDFCISQGFEVK
jgi:hypothetical protein